MVVKTLNCRQQRTVILERWESVGELSLLQKSFQNVALGEGGGRDGVGGWGVQSVLGKPRGLPSRADGAENPDVKVGTVFRPSMRKGELAEKEIHRFAVSSLSL